MAIKLPDDAGGLTLEKEQTPESIEMEKATMLQKLANLPSNLLDAFTGEGVPIEYPNIPEATEMVDQAPGIIEALMPNLKAFFARDDAGKAEIFKDAFKDDPRFGGIYSDKFENPMIVWNEQPFYINKPGFSGQDIGTFIGEIIKFLPASKYVSGAKTLLGTVARGLPAYSTTEAIGKGVENIMTPETTKAKKQELGDVVTDIGSATALGVAADTLLPPVAKGIGKVFAKGAEKVGIKLPKFSPEVIKSTSKYELTKGQQRSLPPKSTFDPQPTDQLEKEDLMRRAAGSGGQKVIKVFDEAQTDEIVKDAQALQNEFGSGKPFTNLDEPDVTGAAGEEIQSIVSKRAGEMKTEAGELYNDARNPVLDTRMTRDGIRKAVGEAIFKITNPREGLGIIGAELDQMPILKRELTFLKKLLKASNNPRFKDQDLNTLHSFQKRLNRSFRTAAPGSPEKLALGEIKGTFDNALFKGIDEGFIYGDEDALKALQNATGLYKDYMGLTGKIKGATPQQKASNKILEKITNPEYTPRQVANAIFGHSKFAPNQALPLAIDKLKSILPEEESAQVIALLKDGILEKAFAGTGKSGVTRTNIVNNYNDIFVKQKRIIEKLFSPEEIKKIADFRRNVMPTLWAEIKLNPSGTGYILASALTRNRIFSSLKMVPIAGEPVVAGVEDLMSRGRALDMTRQFIERASAPLFSSVVQASIRPEVVETIGGEDASSPALQNIIEGLNEEERQKLLEATSQ
tara:strand:- start:13782 stop:16013 length:2232 start_codon:yes stop_codon:yes gene_type:complete